MMTRNTCSPDTTLPGSDPNPSRSPARYRARRAGYASRRHARLIPVLAMAVAMLGGMGAATGCGLNSVRAAVTLSLNGPKGTPADASVTIDEQYVGPLYYVAAHGVRLPKGEHRISVTREGYFPWDRLVTANREPIHLAVELVPIPD